MKLNQTVTVAFLILMTLPAKADIFESNALHSSCTSLNVNMKFSVFVEAARREAELSGGSRAKAYFSKGPYGGDMARLEYSRKLDDGTKVQLHSFMYAKESDCKSEGYDFLLRMLSDMNKTCHSSEKAGVCGIVYMLSPK